MKPKRDYFNLIWYLILGFVLINSVATLKFLVFVFFALPVAIVASLLGILWPFAPLFGIGFLVYSIRFWKQKS